MSDGAGSKLTQNTRHKWNLRVRADPKWESACRMLEIRLDLAQRGGDKKAVRYLQRIQESFMRLARLEMQQRPNTDPNRKKEMSLGPIIRR